MGADDNSSCVWCTPAAHSCNARACGFGGWVCLVWFGFFNDRDNIMKTSLLNPKILSLVPLQHATPKLAQTMESSSAFVSTDLSSTDVTLKIILGVVW